MITMAFILFLSTINLSYAAPYTACLSHGDCQEAHPAEDSTRCLKIITGTDALGNSSCAIRCYPVKRAYQCIKINETLAHGVCLRERFNIPIIDPNEPDCSDALEFSWD